MATKTRLFDRRTLKGKLTLYLITIILIGFAFIILISGGSRIADDLIEINEFDLAENEKYRNRISDHVDVVYELVKSNYEESTSKEYIIERYGEQLKNLVELADSIAGRYINMARAGRMTMAQARRNTIEEIKSIRYDDGVGYLWINDMGKPFPRMIMHPISPQLDGKIMDSKNYNVALGEGKNLFVAFVDVCEKDGEGYVDYLWPKPTADGLTTDQPKLSYVKLIKEWNWVIGTGIYVDDAVSNTVDRLLSDIKKMRYGSKDGGYFFINNTEAPIPRLIMHPTSPELENVSLDIDQFYTASKHTYNPKGSLNLFKSILEVVNSTEEREGFVYYQWPKLNKDGKTTKNHPKVTFVKLYEPLGWIIGSGLYISDIEETVAEKEWETYWDAFKFILLLLFFAIVVGGGAVFFIIRLATRVSNPIHNVVEKAKLVSAGDLTVEYEYQGDDEIGDLVEANRIMVDALKTINKKIFDTVIVMTHSLKSLFKTSTKVAESSNVQADTLGATKTNVESVSQIVEIISDESLKAEEYAKNALERVHEGVESMNKLQTEMKEIEASSKQINEFIELINDIAEQTNLLSLNASIESARAGEAGVGFSVVSSEIRKLAEKSTISANRIQQLIHNNNLIIERGVRYSNKTTDGLKEISKANDIITNVIHVITGEVEKLRTGSKDIIQAMEDLSSIATTNLTESENVQNIINQFVKNTLDLQKLIGQFDVRTKELKENQENIEQVLEHKAEEALKLMNPENEALVTTEELLHVGQSRAPKLSVGIKQITMNEDLVDEISSALDTAVTIFQPVGSAIVRVATTIKRFDESRAVGTAIGKDSDIFKTVMDGKTYFGRAFVISKWYVSIYKPIRTKTGKIAAIIFLGLPEQIEAEEKALKESQNRDETSSTNSAFDHHEY